MVRAKERIHSLPQETSTKGSNQNIDFGFPLKNCNEGMDEKDGINKTLDPTNVKKSDSLSVSEKHTSYTHNLAHGEHMHDISTETYPDIESYDPLWKYTNNSSIMKYRWMRQLRNEILLDLKRHFGREVKHNRLFSCLCKSSRAK